MNPEAIFEKIKNFSEDSGFNIFNTVRRSEYDNLVPLEKSALNLLPETESITLICFGGNEFWKIFQSFLNKNPGFKEKGEDLIDNYTKMVFQDLSLVLDEARVKHTSVFPFGSDAMALDFVKLGQATGTGVPSSLGLLLNPVYGPWLSLRGALLTDIEPESYDSALKDFAPCPTCDKPCIAACPAQTISEKGWDWESCMRYRLAESTCSANCASRRACPYGKETQYSEEQLAYHHGFVLRSVKAYFKEK